LEKESSSFEKESGKTGLSVLIIKRVVQESRKEITFESNHERKGAIFFNPPPIEKLLVNYFRI